jgi:hypothetical protein
MTFNHLSAGCRGSPGSTDHVVLSPVIFGLRGFPSAPRRVHVDALLGRVDAFATDHAGDSGGRRLGTGTCGEPLGSRVARAVNPNPGR